jgi:ABC-type glycerol-3-phosphate transport system substrate-binding protein
MISIGRAAGGTKRGLAIGIAGLAVLLLAAACAPGNATPSPSATATPAGETADIVVGAPSPAATAAATPGKTEPRPAIHLTLWTVEPVSPQAEGAAGRAFANGLHLFEETYRDVSVTVVLKNVSGKGNVLDYLRTASQVAPSILPDVVVLDTVDLASAARAGIVVPLDDLASPLLTKDLLPAALRAGTVDDQLVGVPFEMDVEHLIYNTNKVTSAPISWTDVVSSNVTYVFPAKGRNGLVNDAFLIQYLASGGRLHDDEGRLLLDEQPLRAALDYYRQGEQMGVMPASVLDVSTPDDVWPAYLSAKVGMAHVNSHRFLTDRGVLHSTQFADIPTRDGIPLAIGRGRVLAIVARDPARQAMAMRLIEWLMSPDSNATWNQATAHLPTRYAAFNLLANDDPYWLFLRHQLEIAVPPPAFPGYDQVGRVLQQAVVEVMTGEATPEVAAAAAVAAIIP